MKDYMNVKEICELCGKNKVTVLRWIEKIYPVKIVAGKETKLDINEVRMLFNKVLGEIITNALFSQLQNETAQLQNVTVERGTKISGDNEFDFHMMQAMTVLNKRVKENSDMIKAQTNYLYNKIEKQLPAPSEEYFTLSNWMNLKSIFLSGEQIRITERRLIDICEANNIEIKYIENGVRPIRYFPKSILASYRYEEFLI